MARRAKTGINERQDSHYKRKNTQWQAEQDEQAATMQAKLEEMETEQESQSEALIAIQADITLIKNFLNL